MLWFLAPPLIRVSAWIVQVVYRLTLQLLVSNVSPLAISCFPIFTFRARFPTCYTAEFLVFFSRNSLRCLSKTTGILALKSRAALWFSFRFRLWWAGLRTCSRRPAVWCRVLRFWPLRTSCGSDHPRGGRRWFSQSECYSSRFHRSRLNMPTMALVLMLSATCTRLVNQT